MNKQQETILRELIHTINRALRLSARRRKPTYLELERMYITSYNERQMLENLCEELTMQNRYAKTLAEFNSDDAEAYAKQKRQADLPQIPGQQE